MTARDRVDGRPDRVDVAFTGASGRPVLHPVVGRRALALHQQQDLVRQPLRQLPPARRRSAARGLEARATAR